MSENLKKLLRDVFSVDTEAGYRMRYHITRALVCEDYAETIRFISKPRLGLLGVFEWSCTIEGYKYWNGIRNSSMTRPEYI
jgi:hypothetical protein